MAKYGQFVGEENHGIGGETSQFGGVLRIRSTPSLVLMEHARVLTVPRLAGCTAGRVSFILTIQPKHGQGDL